MKSIETHKRTITAFVSSGIIAVVFIAVATIYGEIHAPFKVWLAETFYHHWMGKGVISILIFLVGGALFSGLLQKKSYVTTTLFTLFLVTVVSSLAIIGFYIDHIFNH